MANLLHDVGSGPRPEIDNVVEHAAGLRSLSDAGRLLGMTSSQVLSLARRGVFPDAFQVGDHWRIPLHDIRRMQLARAGDAQTDAAVLVRTRRPYDEPRAPQAWMTPAERREFIARLVTTQRSVKVTALSAALGVSQMTVRRDLGRLEDEGRLIRSYGGAMAPGVPALALGLPLPAATEDG